MGKTVARLLLAVLCAVIGTVLWHRYAFGADQLINRLPAPQLQPSVTPFLYPPYYGSEQVNCVFDHEYPIYFTGEKDFGEPISSTVVHNDGVRRPEGGIGTPGCYSGHDGVDYGLVYENILAASSGNVGRARWANAQNHQRGLGLFVRIDHASSYSTSYGHLSAVSVQEDTQVAVGQVVGISGTSGNSTGPHLHFGTTGAANVANPYGWIGSPEISVDPWLGLPQGQQASINLWTHLPSTTNDIYPSGLALTAPPLPQPGQPNVVLVEDSAPIIGDGCQQAAGEGYGGGSFHYAAVISDSLNTGLPPTCSLRWNIPGGAAGAYDVYAYIPAASANTESAVYQIVHQGITSQAIVHQDHFPDNQWAFLGQYAFNRDGSEYVTSSNVTLDVTNTLSIAFDALLFAPGAGIEPTPTATPGPSPTPTRTSTPALTHTPAEIVRLPMNETNPIRLTEVHGHPVTAVNVELTRGYTGATNDYSRRFAQRSQLTPAYSRITLGASEDYYAADTPNRSLTVDLWFRYSDQTQNSTQPQTIVNLLAEGNGKKRGWELTFTPAGRKLAFAVYVPGLRTSVSLPITNIPPLQWVRLKAIRDGNQSKLILCAMPAGSAWQSAEQHYAHSIAYFRTTPNAPSSGNTLDLGVVYTGWQFDLNANWYGDIDEFVYKNYADTCQNPPTMTPALTPAPTATRTPTPTPTPRRVFLPLVVKFWPLPEGGSSYPAPGARALPENTLPPPPTLDPGGAYPGPATQSPTATSTYTPVATRTLRPTRTPRK